MTGQPRRVLLIQPEWPVRALLKAELEDRGFDVLGADSVGLASRLCMERGFRPDLLLVDAVDLELAEEDLREIAFLRGGSPLVLLASGQYVDQAAERLSPNLTIRRPTTVGEIAETVERILSG